MKKPIAVMLCLLLAVSPILGEDRFGRPVVELQNSKDYEITKLDDVEYAGLSNDRYHVTCLVYRGRENYYVEVSVTNKTETPLALSPDFIGFSKPGYSVARTDSMLAAMRSASFAGIRFVPTPPPYVPPTTTTTIDAQATTYGDQTQISGTATTTTDSTGQAGANLGNAIGNAIAAHRFYKKQRTEVAFSHFLAAHVQTAADSPLLPGESRVLVATFEQAKPKKKDFKVVLQIGADNFDFAYKE